jgi:fatty-acid desaturase
VTFDSSRLTLSGLAPIRSGVLVHPQFGLAKDHFRLYRPTRQDLLKELTFVLFTSDRASTRITAAHFFFQCATLIAPVVYVSHFFTLPSLFFALFSIPFLGTVYNTVWFHRYCSHAAFEFRRQQVARFLLWSNPLALMFREEIYAIPHMIHHARAEKAGDPYGPHLGWLGNFLAPEITQRINSQISEKEFGQVKSIVSHIGFKTSSYADFCKTGSIEDLRYFFLRTIVCHMLWSLIIFYSGGLAYVASWYSAIFAVTVLLRDFSWRGHGGNFRHFKKSGWEFDNKSYALNQRFYGYLASEWHDNHHKYPFSANNGFLPGQIDIAFALIKLMHRIGIVKSYMDAKPLFEKECLGIFRNNR